MTRRYFEIDREWIKEITENDDGKVIKRLYDSFTPEDFTLSGVLCTRSRREIDCSREGDRDYQCKTRPYSSEIECMDSSGKKIRGNVIHTPSRPIT
jgi:hypothetical protein